MNKQIKEDYIHPAEKERHNRACKVLAAVKARHAKLEFVRIPLENNRGYREIERTKYERMIRESETTA